LSNLQVLHWVSRWSILRIIGVAAIALVGPQPVFSQDQIEIVNFQSLTFPGSLFIPPFMAAPQDGTPATIFGVLRLPEGTGRVPAVVVTHGCSGITGAETYWGGSLVQLGIATFVVNSFAGRGIPRVCSGPHTISAASVLTDVYRARDLLAAHPRIDRTRIALMGFSFGGRTALWASHPRFEQRYGLGPSRFAAHLAFYPTSCHIRLADEGRVGDAPIRIFHGAADEMTIISRCREYVAKLRNVLTASFPGTTFNNNFDQCIFRSDGPSAYGHAFYWQDYAKWDTLTNCVMVLRSTGAAFTQARPWACPGAAGVVLAGRVDSKKDGRTDVLINAGGTSWQMLRSVK